ncbi:MAG: N4-gp56 family major capsid protein [Eubacteriales bacterium]|nr:N4-gp56 family major capsid protein [Eubacteriales bacterium]
MNTTQTLSAEMRTFYEKTLIDNAEPKLVYDAFADKYPIPQGNGKHIQFRKYSSLPKALKPLTEGVTPQGKHLQVQSVEAEVEQFGDYVQLSDMLKLTALDNNILQVSKLLGSQAGRTLDSISRDVLCGGTNVYYANNANGEVHMREELDEQSKLSPVLFHKAAAQLAAMNADTINGSYIAIIHPYTAYDLMQDKEWIDSHKYANPENIYNGEIGKIGNVRFVVSSEAKVLKSKDLADTRTLTVKSVSGNTITIEETLSPEQVQAVQGRLINIGDVVYTVQSATSTSLVCNKAPNAKAKDIIYPSETGKKGLACFCTIVLGAHAYATTEIEGGGLSHIVKQNGYGDDPLNQRASVGWKASKAVQRLVEEFLIRIESTSAFSGTVEEN